MVVVLYTSEEVPMNIFYVSGERVMFLWLRQIVFVTFT